MSLADSQRLLRRRANKWTGSHAPSRRSTCGRCASSCRTPRLFWAARWAGSTRCTPHRNVRGALPQGSPRRRKTPCSSPLSSSAGRRTIWCARWRGSKRLGSAPGAPSFRFAIGVFPYRMGEILRWLDKGEEIGRGTRPSLHDDDIHGPTVAVGRRKRVGNLKASTSTRHRRRRIRTRRKRSPAPLER